MSSGEPLVTAIARTTDPLTTREAGDEVAISESAASQRHLCLLEVWKSPGRTAAEIAEAAGLKRHAPSRRLPELRRAGQVKNGPTRLCSITGNPSLVWLPAPELN